jgi:two-component system phosphate regulon response regulator PhoB
MQIDLDSHRLIVDGQELPVTSLEMRLLVFLARADGRVCSRKSLLTHVWDYDPGVPSRTVDTHVKRLRQKLGLAGLLIQTVRGLGYRLSDPYESTRRTA